MGFKNKLNKMKSFLFDDEEEVKKPKLKKEPKIVEEKVEKNIDFSDDYSNNNLNNTIKDDLYFEDISDNYVPNNSEVKSRTVKNEREFKFPEFNDDDFLVSKKMEEPKIIEPPKKEEVRVPLYQGSKRKEETKKFKPTPFISPVYGLLDNEGKTVKKENVSEIIKDRDEISLDDIRKKAYGTYEEEETLKNLNSKTIEEAEKDFEDKLKQVKSKEETKSAKRVEKTKKIEIEQEEDDDDMILPNVNFKEINVKTPSIKSSIDDDDDDDTKEQDLFNIIDTMYKKGEKDDD